MRNNEKNFKGKFYVGQRVKVDLSDFSYVPKSRITTDGKGIIQKINSRFLKTPSLTSIVYEVRFNKGMLCNQNKILVKGEKLQALKGE